MNTKDTLPKTLEEAIEMMRFGCPYLENTVGEFDVQYFERRMFAAAALLEKHLRNVPRWIRVDEELPTEDGWYNILDGDNETRSTLFVNGSWLGDIVEPLKAWAHFPSNKVV